MSFCSLTKYIRRPDFKQIRDLFTKLDILLAYDRFP